MNSSYFSSKNFCNDLKHQQMREHINLLRMNFENQNFEAKTSEKILKFLKSDKSFSNCNHIQVFNFYLKFKEIIEEKETKLLYFIQLRLSPGEIRILSKKQLDMSEDELKKVY
jgi:hypothetical protein